MPFLFHQRASLDLDHVPHLARPLRTNHEAWERLVQLMSLARALDPSLPHQLRFFKHTPDDPVTVPFVAVLTDSTEPDLRASSLSADAPVRTMGLHDALAQTLPENVLRAEMAAIEGSDEQNFASAIDAAVYTAFRDVQIELHTVVEVDPVLQQKVRYVSSGNYRIPTLAFMNNADLARQAWLSPLSTPTRQEQGRDPMDGSFARIRAGVQRARELLSRPMAEASEAEHAELPQLLHALNGRHDPAPFEQRQEHGWIAFALAHRAGDWVPTLLQAGADPRQPYGRVSPTALAIATNDATALGHLLEAGVSANQVFDGLPAMFDDASVRWLKGFNDQVVPALVLAAVMGADEAANRLLHHGAHVDASTETGRFPLMIAAQNGDTAMVRTLVAHGADLALEDAQHRLPEEMIPDLDAQDPQAPAMEALYDQLSGWRLGGARPAIVPLAAGKPVSATVDEATVLAAEAAQPAKPKATRRSKAVPAPSDVSTGRPPSKANLARKLDSADAATGGVTVSGTPQAKRRSTT